MLPITRVLDIDYHKKQKMLGKAEKVQLNMVVLGYDVMTTNVR